MSKELAQQFMEKEWERARERKRAVLLTRRAGERKKPSPHWYTFGVERLLRRLQKGPLYSRENINSEVLLRLLEAGAVTYEGGRVYRITPLGQRTLTTMTPHPERWTAKLEAEGRRYVKTDYGHA